MMDFIKVIYVVAMMFIMPCGLFYMGANDIVVVVLSTIITIISLFLLFLKDDEFKSL